MADRKVNIICTITRKDGLTAVGQRADGGLVVGSLKGASLELELEFERQDAANIAIEVLANNSQAITKPGSMRMLAAGLVDALDFIDLVDALDFIDGDGSVDPRVKPGDDEKGGSLPDERTASQLSGAQSQSGAPAPNSRERKNGENHD